MNDTGLFVEELVPIKKRQIATKYFGTQVEVHLKQYIEVAAAISLLGDAVFHFPHSGEISLRPQSIGLYRHPYYFSCTLSGYNLQVSFRKHMSKGGYNACVESYFFTLDINNQKTIDEFKKSLEKIVDLHKLNLTSLSRR